MSKLTQHVTEKNLADARKTAKSARKAAASRWADVNDAFDGAVSRLQHSGKRAPRRGPWVAAAALGVAFGAMGAGYTRRLAKARERAAAEDAAAAVAADLQASDRASYGTRLNGSSAPGTASTADISTAPESSDTH